MTFLTVMRAKTLDNRAEHVLFFVYELNRLHQECMVKAQHLANVTSGNVTVTFKVIDVCAEVFNQLMQLSDLFTRIANDVNQACHKDELERIEEMRVKITQYQSEGSKHWNRIRNWDIRNKYPEFRK